MNRLTMADKEKVALRNAPKTAVLSSRANVVCDANFDDSLWTLVRACSGLTGNRDWRGQVNYLRDVFSSALNGIGVRCFSYHIVRCSSISSYFNPKSCIISTFPDRWIHQYHSENYAADDPILEEVLQKTLPFRWSAVRHSKELVSQRQHQFFKDAHAVGLDECITIPIHMQNGIAALSVAPHAEAEERMRLNSHLLYLLAHFFHSKVRRPVVETALATSSRRRSVLSPRETQVLEWAAEGKLTGEIATQLNISPKSIEFHIESAKQKLRVSNRTHAVAKAIMLGLLSLD